MGERGVWLSQESEKGRLENVVSPHPPVALIDPFEDRERVFGDEVTVLACCRLERIDAHREVALLRADEDDVLETVARDARDQSLDEIPFRIEYPDTATRGDVLRGEVDHRGGLAGTGRTQQVEVMARVLNREAHRL